MNLSELLYEIEEEQVAEATFADDTWYIIRKASHIWYYDPYHSEFGDKVPLTYSNIKADYRIEKDIN